MFTSGMPFRTTVGRAIRPAAGFPAGATFLRCLLLAALAALVSCTHGKHSAGLVLPPQVKVEADADRDAGADRDGRHNEPDHDDNPFESAEYFREKRVMGDGLLPMERYTEGLRHAGAMRHYSIGLGRFVEGGPKAPSTFGTWQSLGPGNVGGRTRGLVVHPQNSKIMWAGGATGGIWKTTDGGQTWLPVSDFAPVMAINCLVMEPSDPNTLYACTGEQTQNWRGAGIYKTTDGGNTWSQLASTTTPDFYFINNIAISRVSPGRLYAATNTGLWMSPDGGGTWNLSLASPDGGPAATLTSGTTNGCFDVAVQPGQTVDAVLATCHQPGSVTYSVFRNPDAAGAGTWSMVLTDPNMWYVALAFAPSQPNTVYGIAVNFSSTSAYSHALLAVYRSTNGGATWTTQDSSTSTNRLNSAILSVDSAYNFSGAFCTAAAANVDFAGQAGYNLYILVDPLDANRVWAAGLGLFRSDDGGVNWGYAFNGNHPDQHVLAFDPGFNGTTNQILYNGNDGGVYLTLQARGITGTCANKTTTINWTSLNNSYTATQFYHGVPYPGGAAYFGGTQDNGTVRGSDSGGRNGWGSIYGGDGGVSRVDALDANTVYVEYVHGAFAKSTDGGFTYSNTVTGITETSSNFPFIAWYLFDPNNSLRLFTGGRQLWRSENGQASWTAASAPIDLVGGNLDNIRTIAISPADSNLVLFGTHYGKIFRNTATLSANANTVWNFTTPRTGNVSHIEFDPHNPSTVYATYTTFNSAPGDNHVYRSTDGGVTWNGIDGAGANGLPDVPAETIAVDPSDSNKLYLGTDIGMFASFDGGNTWVRDDNPFADVIVMNLVIDGADLYAFTYGRGVWRVTLPESGGSASFCTYTVSPLNLAADVTGGVYPINITTQPGCAWSARTTAPVTSTSLPATLQPPSSGVGSGAAYLTVAPTVSQTTRSGTFLVQNQTVTVTQAAAAASTASGNEISTAGIIPALPFLGTSTTSSRTENATDPKHSCTSSADFQTSWMQFTAPKAGNVQLTLQGIHTSGTSGSVVLTAYPLSFGAVGAELACVTLTLDAGTPSHLATATIPVTAATSYAIEVSALSKPQSDFWFLGVSMAPATPTFDVSPPESLLQPGQTQLFQAVTSNLGNRGVRWLLTPQVGVIAPDGTYTAPSQTGGTSQVTVTGQSLGNAALKSTATISIGAAPAVTLGNIAVTNAASFQVGAVAPGEIVTLFGAGIGPAATVTAQLNAQGRVASNLSGTQVLFDNIPAPLVYVTPNQVSAIVPYDVAGHDATRIVVVRNGQATQTLVAQVTAVAPALFTSLASGSGPAAAINQDTTLNGVNSGAPVGSVVALYATGEGQTLPGGINGRVANVLLPAPAAGVTAKIGGLDAQVYYAGAAPQAVAGLMQVNVQVPNLPPGTYPVVLTVGGTSTKSDVTLTVR
jgi:uncharacterized protein (TIGR03437 family)